MAPRLARARYLRGTRPPATTSLLDRAQAADDRDRHLAGAARWLLRSIEHGEGGSCAYFSLVRGWSLPYPETSGYIIPTLLRLAEHFPGLPFAAAASRLGSWLLDIQRPEGAWNGGLHRPNREGQPSVFNTAQVLQGLIALADRTDDGRYLDSAHRGARWMAAGVGKDGTWPPNDYRAEQTPSYYTYAAWPMLEVWRRTRDPIIRDAAVTFLDTVLRRRTANGAFRLWGFDAASSAYTHTIAYTVQGLLGSSRVLSDWPTYGRPAQLAMSELTRLSLNAEGRLPGRLKEDWTPAASYVCLTGNAQVALCLLDDHDGPLHGERVTAAAQLVDVICAVQRLRAPVGGIRGAVAGSSPVWGRYMMLRYPNWAAKYLCDALLTLIHGPPRVACVPANA